MRILCRLVTGSSFKLGAAPESPAPGIATIRAVCRDDDLFDVPYGSPFSDYRIGSGYRYSEFSKPARKARKAKRPVVFRASVIGKRRALVAEKPSDQLTVLDEILRANELRCQDSPLPRCDVFHSAIPLGLPSAK